MFTASFCDDGTNQIDVQECSTFIEMLLSVWFTRHVAVSFGRLSAAGVAAQGSFRLASEMLSYCHWFRLMRVRTTRSMAFCTSNNANHRHAEILLRTFDHHSCGALNLVVVHQ